MPSYLPIRVGSQLLTISVAGSAPPPGALPSSFADMTISGGSRMLIPLYGGSPTHYLITNGGLWSDPTVWSTGTVPTATSDVQIQAGADVTVTGLTAVARDITVQGNLHVCCGPGLLGGPCVNTRLTCRNVSVLDGGMFAIGEVADPVDVGVTAELVFADSAIDTTFDPEQFGHGLLATGMGAMPGMVRMCGAARTPTFLRLAAEAHAGDTTLTLSGTVSGWLPGDLLYLPDSRQFGASPRFDGDVYRQEILTVANISGTTVTLTAPLAHDHLGARDPDGVLVYLPHVANLTRNVVVRSANPAGVRGHSLFTGRADVDIRHAQFRDLGRTTNDPLDSTTFPGGDPTATPSHVGTNQIGRYPIHFHHMPGPAAIPANGYQFTLSGDSIYDTGAVPPDTVRSKWPVAIHDSHYGLVSDNVVVGGSGAGITTEDGSEYHNVLDHNFVAQISGTGANGGDLGRDGDGFWMRGPANYVRNNVCCNINPLGLYSDGFNYFSVSLGTVTVPASQGADPMVSGMSVNMNATPFLQFADNEVYSSPEGMGYFWIGATGEVSNTVGTSTVANLTIWNVHNYGIYAYSAVNILVDNLKVLCDASQLNGQASQVGVHFSDYYTDNFVLQNSSVVGCMYGARLPVVTNNINYFKSSTFWNVTDFDCGTLWRVDAIQETIGPRHTVIQGIAHDLRPLPGHASPVAIDMVYTDTNGHNLIKLDRTFVVDFDGTAGDNFQVFYAQQAPTFVVPQSVAVTGGHSLVGCPEAGLTNAQAYVKYHADGTLKSPTGTLADAEGCAIAGAVLPAGATTRAKINGYVL